jgi:hypothetical protein
MSQKSYDINNIEVQKDELINYLKPLNKDFLKKLSFEVLLNLRDF